MQTQKEINREKKINIRKQALFNRDSLSVDERKRSDLLLADRIIGHQLFYSSKRIFSYASYKSEASTEMINEEALKLGKELYLPKVEGEEIVFYRVNCKSDLILGYKGIPEPAFGLMKADMAELKDALLIMPGVAFDAKRCRIGYGKGFYDRFLAKNSTFLVRSIAIGYKCQMFDDIPETEYDLKPGQIICM